MRRASRSLVLVVAVIAALTAPAASSDFVSVHTGLLVQPVQYPCPLRPETKQWAANDWDTSVVIQQANVRAGDRVIAEVSIPGGRVFVRRSTWSNAAQRGCTWLFIPILGTDAETWLGTWRASILINDKKVADVSWEVVSSREGLLAEYQAFLAANPNSARAHYRVGAAAALVGQDALAEAVLKEAARIAPTWWYPYLALGRLYHRQGQTDKALEQFHFLRGLLLGRQADPGSFTALIQAMLDDHLQQLGQ